MARVSHAPDAGARGHNFKLNQYPTFALFDFYVGLHRHSRPQQVLWVLSLFEHYLDGHSLDDLDVITRGILGREQAVACSAGPGNVENMPVVCADRKSTRLNSSHGYISY